VIESPLPPCGSRTKSLLMAFKLLDMAQLQLAHDGFDGIQLLSQVCAGTKFVVHEDRPKRIYSLKRKATADGRLIMTGRSTSFDVSALLQVG